MVMKAPSSLPRGFITRVVNPSQTLRGFDDVGMIVSVWVQVLSVIHDAARSALGVIGVGAADLFAERRGSSVGATPSPAVKGRCGIRLDPGGRRHAGTGFGLDVLARPPAVP
jgi:hypothetical protein